jgi:group I intron endonuclease
MEFNIWIKRGMAFVRVKNPLYNVYKHISPTGKIYIGITMNEPNKRWRNGKGYSYNVHFMNAINKYGWNNFIHEVMFTNISKSFAKKMEQKLIELYNSNNPQYGYNLTIGGDTNIPLVGEKNGMYGRTHTQEIKDRLKKQALERYKDKTNHPMYGTHRTEETKQKLSKAHKGKCAGEKNYFYGKDMSGENHPMFGKSLTEEHRKKISEARMGKYRGENNPNSIPIRCVETGECFECATEVKRKYGYDNSHISKCCKGLMKAAYGYHWEYLNNQNNQAS